MDPSAVLNNPSVVLNNPSVVLMAPSAALMAPSAVLMDRIVRHQSGWQASGCSWSFLRCLYSMPVVARVHRRSLLSKHQTVTVTTVTQANCDEPSQCCVVGCQECQAAHFTSATSNDENVLVFGPASPMHSHYIFRTGQPLDLTKGVARCSFDIGSDQGCCEVRKFERTCGEKTACSESSCGSSDRECGEDVCRRLRDNFDASIPFRKGCGVDRC